MQMQAPDSNSNTNLNTEAAMTKHEQLDCPRCGSNNTKFCYYNNYNTSQPRYLCKNCRRYWTKGGALRNIPIGGGTRKKSSTKSLVKKQVAKSTSVSTPIDHGHVVHPQPMPISAYQPAFPADLNGYVGNFNLSLAGYSFVAPEIQSSTESSGGENEMFSMNGDFGYFLGGWQ